MDEQQEQKTEWSLVEPGVWKPEKTGDSIEGIYIIKKENIGVNKSTTYYLENKNGQKMIWGSTVLDSRMSVVKIGEKIKIEYCGTQPNTRGQDTKIFQVFRETINPPE